jgi:VWFA-related protein
VTQQPSVAQFKASADLVVLDVSVLDRGRRPVTGLTADDFSVLEDEKSQPIMAFQEIRAPAADAETPKWMGRATADVQSNKTPDGRLILLYLDERTGSIDPFFSQTAKNVAHAFIDRLAPNDVAAVAFVLDHRGTQEFTTDRGRLHAAVETFAASPYVEVSVVRTMKDVAAHLGAIPERRKIIAYIGGGEPFDVAVLTAMDRASARPGEGPDSLRNFQQRDLYDRLLDLFRTAQRANVSIYTLDPIGLTVQKPNSSAGGPGDPSKEFLRILATNTGGRAIVNDNAPVAAVPAILGESAAYYLLGFRPIDLKTEGRFRRIQVKVNRPNVEIRARRGYVEAKPTVAGAPADGSVPEISLLPASEIRLDVCAIPIGPGPNGLNSVALAMSAVLSPRNGLGFEHVSVSYSVLDMGGRDRGNGRRDFVVTSQSSPAESSVHALALEHLAPGRYDVRVSATSVEGARRGELIADIQVPDFRKEPLSASGVIIEESPAPKALPVDALAAVVAGIPTTSRQFNPAGRVAASMQLYQGISTTRAMVTVKASITDRKDSVVFEAVERFDGSRFATGAVHYTLQLPLSQLSAGPHLLQFEISRPSSSVVRRQVQFEVR